MRKIVAASEQFDYWQRLAASPDGRHPDLHEAEQLFGVAHTTGGRRLDHWRVAATPEEQEARLAEPNGWTHHVAFPPSQLAIDGARQYSASRGLPDPHSASYEHVMQDPDSVRRVGQAYDALPAHDPAAVPHYEAMRREVNDQYDHMTNNLGINVQTVDHDPYPDAHHMVDDVNNNKRLQVLGTHVTGAHPYFSNEDNDKFRAVHDFFGHAATGRSFDRHGEQAAFLAHSKMFSPQARPALHAETQGQNSSLILNGQFGPQKIATMPESMWNTGGPHAMGKTARWFTAGPNPHDRRWKDQAMEEAERNDFQGLTFKHHPGDAPQHGYMVSVPGHEEVHDIDSLSGGTLGDYRQRKNDVINEPGNYQGGWHEDRKWYNDVSKNHPDLWHADKDAFQGNQLALYDIDRDKGVGTDEAGWMVGAPWITGSAKK